MTGINLSVNVRGKYEGVREIPNDVIGFYRKVDCYLPVYEFSRLLGQI